MDRFSHDGPQVEPLLEQINDIIDHFLGDGAYDEAPVYDAVINHSPAVDVVVPPRSNAVLTDKAAVLRNRKIQEIKDHGRIGWQKTRQYGRRNLSKLGIQRYQCILGGSMHARDFFNQKQEAMIGCDVLNKMTSLGMLASYRSA